MKLIVGLGNPGKEYDKTRHSVGFAVLDEYLKGEKWSENKYAHFIKQGNDAVFVKPTTFMNLSGNAVRYFASYYKIDIEDILIIQDDLDIEVGRFKLKTNSSSGGHNGILSIIENLGTCSFLRLKIGIGSPKNGDTINYVLKKFSKADCQQIEKNRPTFENIIRDFIDGKAAEHLMNEYNKGI